MAGTLRRLRAIPEVSRLLGKFEMLNVSNMPWTPTFLPRLEVSTSATASAPAGVKLQTRSPTSYQLFQKDTAGKFAPTGNMSAADRNKRVASAWKALSDAERKPYEEKALKLKVEFYATHGKPKKSTRSAPKRPLTSYAAYVKANFAAAKGQSSESTTSVVQKLAQQWKQLSPAEKAKYSKAE